jgi:3-dehydroquinate synthase
MHTLTVDLGERSYPIHIGPGLLRRVGEWLAAAISGRRALMVTHPNIDELYGEILRDGLIAAGFAVAIHRVPQGEASKCLDEFMGIQDALFAFGADRGTAVVALGGGVIGDLAGFAASAYMRGVPYVQVPTTLLSQVDSSVGGKTAINHPGAKNIIGAFYQPMMVVADTETLRTLERRELLAGLAEVVKYGVIWDADLFARLEADLAALLALDPQVLAPVIHRCCAIKAEVVAQDEREGGLRAILNFGHTFGHAVEALSGYGTVLHGEAVAMGMVAAARLAERLALCPAGLAERIRALLARAGLLTEYPRLPRTEFLATIGHDKKALGGKPRYVLPREMGRVEVRADVDEAVVLAVAGIT